jgi:hypothetical protein
MLLATRKYDNIDIVVISIITSARENAAFSPLHRRSRTKMKRLAAALAITASIVIFALIFTPRRENGLVTNAKVTSTVAKVKMITNATDEFLHRYHYLPGDLPNPQDVIPACKERKCLGGNGDFAIGTSLTSSGILDHDGEVIHFWEHLKAAGLLPEKFDQETALGGKFLVFFYDGSIRLPFTFEDNERRKRNYIVLTGNNEIDTSSFFLKPEDAASLDRKMDDGIPTIGTVIAAGKSECVREINEEEKSHGMEKFTHLDYNEPDRNSWWKKKSEPCAVLYIELSADPDWLKREYANPAPSVP